jgi:type IV pilus assembly protein PilE
MANHDERDPSLANLANQTSSQQSRRLSKAAHMTPIDKPQGFTLIEVMIVVVIVGILAAIAFPSYNDSVRRGHRTDAQTEMMELAQDMERCFTANNSYIGCRDPNNTDRYGITRTVTATTFTITATPTTTGGQNADPCGVMTLDQSGDRTPEEPPDCWH